MPGPPAQGHLHIGRQLRGQEEFDDVVVGALLEGPGNDLVLPVAKSPVDDALGGEQHGQRFAPSVDAVNLVAQLLDAIDMPSCPVSLATIHAR